MGSISKRVFLSLVIAASCALFADDDPSEVRELKKGMPKEVASLISRMVECNHWGGEEPYDEERSKEIRKAARRLRCGELDSDEMKLRKKYKNHPKILERIDKAKALAI